MRAKCVVEVRAKMRKRVKSTKNKVRLAEKSAPKGAQGPICALLRGFVRGVRSGSNSGAGGGGDEQLGVPVGLEGVVGELAAFFSEALAVGRESRVISNP